jgi:PKD repeat protein
MTEEERDNGLENLFRKKLEENEMITGSDLTGRFMRRLERREFLHFNPARFNIYYLTAAMAALTVAGVILFSGTENDKSTTLLGSKPGISVEKTADKGTEQDEEQPSAPDGKQLSSLSAGDREKTGKEPASSEQGRETAIISGTSATETISVSTIRKEKSVAMTPPLTILSADASVTSGCLPLHVTFSSNAAEDMKISWSFGDGGTSSTRNPDYIYDIPGIYHVTLSATDSRGRSNMAEIVIEVRDRPKAAFEVEKDETLEPGDKVRFKNLSTGAVSYLWDFGDGTFSTLSDPSYRYEQMGIHDVRLTVWSAEGCADSTTVTNLFTDRGMYIKFPNAFVPNRGGPTGGYYNLRTDEESQVFHPVGSGIASYSLKIYSKVGLLVFESDDIELGWDGYYRGGLSAPGVYVWKVRGTYRNGQTFIMAGDVTLLNY